ncbi:putative uncharacterized protein [Anaerotruncus sp. CAG:390]|nr:putative uncharacterized protein [Anaerotruncus sp. CAG:390]
MRGARIVTRINAPFVVAELERGRIAEHIHVGFPKRTYGTDVLPVAAEGVCVHFFTRGKHCGNDVFAEVVARFFVRLVLAQVFEELFLIEDVNAHRSLGAVGVLRLLREFRYAVIRIGRHDTEAARLAERHLDNGNGAVGAVFLVRVKHLRIVHFVDMVARQHKHIFGIVPVDELNILIDRICGAAVPVGGFFALIGRQDLNAAEGAVKIPRQTVADIIVEKERLILRENTHGINAGVDAVGKSKVDDTVFSAERNGGLGEP